MQTYMNLAAVFLSIVLIAVVLLQVKGGGSGLFGAADGTFRTRRGVEQIMFRFTIFLGVLFVALSLVSVWKPWERF
ncbi:MAG: preprotein translocase subunit SecG [Chloroflexi bacterium]|jgi:protein translocase SecG subunit|nr:MAG: preprotein translocase subunit SecG [Chloroflexota bacterium]